MKTNLQRYSLFIYFVMAYVISWGGCLLIASLKGFQTEAIEVPDIGLMFLFMLAGPSLSGVVLTQYFDGRAGLKQLFGRMKNGHFNWQWAAVAILTIPILSTVALLLLGNFVSPIYMPTVTLANLGFGLVAGLLAGFFEEIGWTGFALPRLQARYAPLASGLILGILWAFWHIMADFWGNHATFDLFWLPTFIIYWLMPLIAYRILMVWMYQNSESLPLMQLMHAFYSGTLGVVGPSTSVEEGLLWKALFAALLWGMVAVVVIRYGGALSRERTQHMPAAQIQEMPG